MVHDHLHNFKGLTFECIVVSTKAADVKCLKYTIVSTLKARHSQYTIVFVIPNRSFGYGCTD